jgi:hypothetical protein
MAGTSGGPGNELRPVGRRRKRRALAPLPLPFDSEYRSSELADADIVEAFGLPVADVKEEHSQGEYRVLYTLGEHRRPSVYVFVRNHDRDGMEGRVDPEGWWPRSDLHAPLDGIGDEAYVTQSGGVVARLGERWTTGVRADAVDRWNPTPEQSADLLAMIVARMAGQKEWNFEKYLPKSVRQDVPDSWRDAKTQKHLREAHQASQRRFMLGPAVIHQRSVRGRLAGAAVLVILALAFEVVSWGLYRQSGAPGLFGRSAYAEVTGDCHGFREHRCEAIVRSQQGRLLDPQATLFSAQAFGAGDDVAVRYRDGNAVPDTIPERFRAAVFAGGVALAGCFILLSAGAVARRRRDAAWTVALWALYAGGGGFAAAFALKLMS